MFKKILLILVLLVAIFAAVVALQPNEFKVTRSMTINTPPDKPFALVNDFHEWHQWSPWEKLDPNMKKSFEGSASGTGAIYRWEGNSDAGKGDITITESKPGELVLMNLHFIEPWEGTSQTEVAFKPDGEKTTVTWTMSGKNSFMGKAMCMFMDMDKMLGSDFERGLAKLKEVSEKP